MFKNPWGRRVASRAWFSQLLGPFIELGAVTERLSEVYGQHGKTGVRAGEERKPGPRAEGTDRFVGTEVPAQNTS